MKTLNLEQMGVQEMNAVEKIDVDGGTPPMGHYKTSGSITAAGEYADAVGSFMVGFFVGLFQL